MTQRDLLVIVVVVIVVLASSYTKGRIGWASIKANRRTIAIVALIGVLVLIYFRVGVPDSPLRFLPRR